MVCAATAGQNPTPCKSVGSSCGGSGGTHVGTENIVYIPGVTCSGNVASSTGASSRSYALVYAVEGGVNSLTEQCIAG